METNIINVGNSKGIIIPAKILKLLQIRDKVQVLIEGNKMIIKPLDLNPRSNWNEQFKLAISANDDSELIPDIFEDEEFDDWTW